MVAAQRLFGRMVLGLPHNAQDYQAVEAATELAECLGLPCLGAFIVEPAMSGLGALTGAQELRSVTAGWQPIESESLARDIQEAVDAARRKFANVAAGLGVDSAFHLARGAAGEILASLAADNDIVAMIQPRHPADRITRQFLGFMEAAFEASSSVMLLPSRVVRKQGPIAVVATGSGDDSAIDAATHMARATGESLLVINASGEPMQPPQLAAERQVSSRVVSLPWRGLPVGEQIATGLAGVQERLIVARRAILDGAQSRAVADRRGVPVFVTG